ncbi:MAG: hypothetical protein M3256_25790, partial [Actinomycetota bacterium]|nr:hypothetical protein [Actinomycetota bacterium]
MRRRIIFAMVAVAALAEAVFALPLAVAVRHRESDRDRRELTQLAALAADGVVDGRLVIAGLPRPLASDQQLGLYDATGQRIDGQGPSTMGTAPRKALANRVIDTKEDGWRVVSVPNVDRGRA